MKKIVFGKVTTNSEGVIQLKDNYLMGLPVWFNVLDIGDYCYISEDGMVKKLREVTKIENLYDEDRQEERKKYYFKDVPCSSFDKPIRSNIILSCKYFKISLYIMNNLLNQSKSNGPNFYELEIEERYRGNVDVKKIDFNEIYREFYFVLNKDNPKLNHRDGDIIIEVSSEKDGYNIKNTFVYEDGNYNLYNLFEKLKNANLPKIGLLASYKKLEDGKKKNLITKIIDSLKKDQYYKHPISSNLKELYQNAFVLDYDENEIVDDFYDFYKYCEKNGGFYDVDLIRRFVTSLRTKRFLLLTGISGTGKTNIAELYGKYLEKYKLIAVESNWNDNKKLLGYRNILAESYGKNNYHNNGYEVPELVKFIKEANKNLDKTYILIFDEMNLSYVERYFSDFLSALESSNNSIALPKNGKIEWSNNIKVIGTVNIDETTYMFSPKVLDRANVIEMDSVKPSKYINWAKDSQKKKEIYMNLDVILDEYTAIMDELYNVTNRGFAFRVIDEISTYIGINLKYGIDWRKSLDEQIVQKILPKIHGTTNKVIVILNSLEDLLKDGDYKLSKAKIEKMRKQSTSGYISFIE